MLDPVRRVASLVFCACAALCAQQRPDLETTLVQFPDNSLPTVLGRLVEKNHAATAELRKLGPAAHEALLGAVLDPLFPRVGLLQAFGEFDARCGWALPLLGDPEVSLSNEVQDLLLRLGPAAAPLVPELHARAAAPRQVHLRGFAEKLAAATDGLVPDSAPREKPKVARELVPALLECLAKGPDERRWPALQALLCLDDDAATAATEALLELSLLPEWQRHAEDLLLTLRCIYSTRCLQGHNPLQRVPHDDLPMEARRSALAGRASDLNALQAWRKSADAGLRRTAALAFASLDSSSMAWRLSLPDDGETDPAVRRALELLGGLRRREGAIAARAALATLRSDDKAKVRETLSSLTGQDLRDAPDEFWPLVIEIATTPTVTHGSTQERMHDVMFKLPQAALPLLYGACRGPDPSPPALVANAPRLRICDQNDRLVRAVLEHADPRIVEEHVRAASESPAALADWIAILRAASNAPQVRERFQPLIAGLVASLPELPAAAQLDWLAIDRGTAVPASVWRALLSNPDVAIRRRASEVAWRGARQHPVALELALPLLADPDPEVARNATFLLAHCKTGRERAVEALVAAFPEANAELQQWIVYALWAQRDVAAPARATIDAAFVSEHPKVRVHAAMLRLHFDRDDAAAFAMLQQLLTHEDTAVRQHAFYQVANDQAVALRCIDAAITALDDPDQQVGYAAARLLGNVPQAKDRSLPALRALLERAPHNSMVAQRARSAITRLEQPEAATEGKR